MVVQNLLTRLGLLLLLVQLSRSQPIPDFIVGAGVVRPYSMCVDPTNGDLWVADTSFSRLLRFTESDGFTTPVAVLGQPNFTSTSALPPSAASLNGPQDVFIDQYGTLWVADTNNARILWYFNVSTKANGADADGLLGQVDFMSTSMGSSGNQFTSPTGLHVDPDGTLWVVDQQNSRVLRFVDALRKSNVGFADSELGQSAFGLSAQACCPSCMNSPATVVTTASGSLFVTDKDNSRVLFFTSGNAVLNDSSASWVIMQKTGSSCTPGSPSAETGWGPNGMAVDPVGNLYVSDFFYNRVLLYPGGAFPSMNGMSASFVYGQPNFTSTTSGTASNSMYAPTGLHFDTMRNVLWVADEANGRVLGFKTFISVPSRNLSLQVSFQGSSPSVVLLPKDNNGVIRPNTFQTLFQPLFIEERDGAGSLISNVSFPLSGYNVSNSVDGMGTQFFNFSISLNQTTVGFEYGLFETEQQMQSAGVEYQIPSSSLKFTLTISGWKCSSPLHSLFVYFSLDTTPAISNTTLQSDPSNSNLVDLVLNSNEQMTTTVRLLKYGVVDGMNTPITFSYDGNLILQFPCFNNLLIYDPDFSVILEVNEPGREGGSGSSLPVLAIVLPVVLVPLALLLVGIIMLVALIVAKWKKKQRWGVRRAQLENAKI